MCAFAVDNSRVRRRTTPRKIKKMPSGMHGHSNSSYFQRCNLLTHTVHVHGSGVFGGFIIPDLPVTVGLGVFGGIL